MINGCPLLKPEIHFEKQSRDLRNRRERKFMFFEKRTSDTDKVNPQHRIEDKC